MVGKELFYRLILNEALVFEDDDLKQIFDASIDKFNVKNFREIYQLIEQGDDIFCQLSSLGQDAIDLAMKGNDVALSIVQEGTRYVADYILNICERLDMINLSEIIIAINGNVIKNNFYRKMLNEALQFDFKKIHWVSSDIDSAIGAGILASNYKGIDISLKTIIRKHKKLNLPRAIINLNYFKQNLKYLQTISNNSKLYPVIKANAYGHGFKEIAKTINSMDIDGVCVATVNELKDLINLNVKYSILHLGNIVFSDIKIYENSNIIATVNSLDDVLKISKMSSVDKLIRVHIKIDTGMSRMGCSINDFDEIFNMCLKVKKIKLEGIYSHLANSDSIDKKLNIKQIKKNLKKLKIE